MIKQTYEEMHRRFDTNYVEQKNNMSGGDIFIWATVAIAMAFLFVGFWL